MSIQTTGWGRNFKENNFASKSAGRLPKKPTKNPLEIKNNQTSFSKETISSTSCKCQCFELPPCVYYYGHRQMHGQWNFGGGSQISLCMTK